MVRVEDLGPALRAAREKAGMTLKELGQAAHVSYITIRKIENGIVVPRGSTLGRLAKALPDAGLKAYLEPVLQHHRAVRAQRRMPEHLQPGPIVGLAERRPVKAGPGLSITEVCRAARAAGLTYGEYVHQMEKEARR